VQTQERVLEIGSAQLRTLIVGELVADKPCIILLHGGLDCLETWKGFPEELSKETDLPVVAYERFGHGGSGQLTEIRRPDYRHVEAESVLPAILEKLGLKKVILVGHSDGAAISLLAAAFLPKTVQGVCAMAPPLIPSTIVREGIRGAVEQFENGRLAEKLRRFHGKGTEGLFYGWAKAWLSEAFDDWSCEEELRKIESPVHLVFGKEDEYGFHESLVLLVENLNTALDIQVLKGIGHMPQHHARGEVIASVKRLAQREFLLES